MLAEMRARYGLLAITGVIASGILGWLPATSASVPTAVSAPSTTFVAVTEQGQRFRSQMSVYSATTGALVRRLASFSDRWLTDNGLAYAPDASAVYFTLIPRERTQRFSLRLMRLDVATGRRALVADGAQPALSADGTQLAYAASPRGLAVRGLATHRTRWITLGELGGSADLLNASITWLGDGSDIAVVPAATAWDLVGKPPRFHWCGTSQTHPVIVFVHVPAPPAPLTGSCVRLAPGALGVDPVLGADPASPQGVLVAAATAGDTTRVQRIATDGAVTRVLTIPHALPLTFDPSGTRLLYLVGHRPPTLTEATLTGGRLIPAPWRNPRLSFGAAAW